MGVVFFTPALFACFSGATVDSVEQGTVLPEVAETIALVALIGRSLGRGRGYVCGGSGDGSAGAR